jgi:oligopeptide/dipeptide ABC transporter ATP-binding protein
VRDELQVVLGGSDDLPGRRSVREVLAAALASGATRGGPADPQSPAELMAEVGLEGSLSDSAVGKLTAHQRALVGLARAVALRPALIVCDQLDTMLADERTLVVDRLLRLRDEAGTALVILARDLADSVPPCDRVVVMYLGCVMEILDRDDLPAAALHPFTHALALPVGSAGPSGSGVVLKGVPLAPAERPTGCVFRTRCFRAQGRCADEVPELTRPLGSTHPVACHFPERIAQGAQGRPADVEAAEDLASPEPTARDFAQG